MGKVKRLRQKFHAASSKAKDKKKSDSQTVEDEEMIELPAKPAPSVISNKDNLFKNVNIPALSLLAQKLPDFDARSSLTSKTFRGQNLKKKDKMKIRQEVWLSKMDVLQTAKKKAKERKKKQQTPIVGDLSSMQDALPTLELLLKKTTGEASNRLEFRKPKPVQKEKARQKQMLDDIALFHKIVQHPLFKEDAVNTITEHLKHKIKSEQNEEENLKEEVDGKSSEPKSKKRKK